MLEGSSTDAAVETAVLHWSGMSVEPRRFDFSEGIRKDGSGSFGRHRRAANVGSVVVHLAVFGVLLAGSSVPWPSDGLETPPLGKKEIVWWALGDGRSTGGGGGGDRGERPTAAHRDAPEDASAREPRRAPMAPRKPKPLSFEDLDVPDLPAETALLFAGVLSPDAVEFPGLSLTELRDLGGIDREASSGSDGGIGGGDGVGVGPGKGWGLGDGWGGYRGGGPPSPGGWDVDPVPIYKPPSPPYPSVARDRMVAGEVILEVLVKRDGTTEVVRVIKTLPHCVEAAVENSKLWRWKPALRKGRPVDAFGIITVTFDIYAQQSRKS